MSKEMTPERLEELRSIGGCVPPWAELIAEIDRLRAVEKVTYRACECGDLVVGKEGHPCAQCGKTSGVMVELAWAKMMTDLAQAQAACAAMHKAACLARRAISSNYLGAPYAAAKAGQMANARRHLDPVCDKPNPGQPFLDRLEQLTLLLTDALPHIECETTAQSGLITAIGEALEGNPDNQQDVPDPSKLEPDEIAKVLADLEANADPRVLDHRN